MLTFVCVRMGTKYGIEYVERLRNMITRHCPRYALQAEVIKGRSVFRPRIVCLTDQPERIEGVQTVNIGRLEGWWAKMALFNPEFRHGGSVDHGPSIYFDLDTVIVDSLGPLVEQAMTHHKFAICANFTRRAGKLNYPCAYGSCVMILPPGFGYDIWNKFHENQEEMIAAAGPFGDQWVIERMIPGAILLQDVMPPGYFVGRREFDVVRPAGAALMIFAGKVKPHNCNIEWITEEWK